MRADALSPRASGAPVHRFGRKKGVGLSAVVLIVLWACGGSGSSDVVVRPFQEVQASDITFEIDPTNPSRTIFSVDTTEQMICAIVWGETEALGNFNNSLNMAGTGIVEHDVFLPGVKPGVEYHYVVQGTTADGTLYRSEPATFTIEAPESTATTIDRGPNLALAATVAAASSEFNEAFAATNAVDGDTTTEWSSAGDGDHASITLDLGGIVAFAGFEFLTRSMTDGTATAETFTVTLDDGTVLGPFPAGNPAAPGFVEGAGSSQTFEFAVESSTGGNTGAIEIRIFGP